MSDPAALVTGAITALALPENRHDNSGVACFIEESPRPSVHAAVNFERPYDRLARLVLT